MTDEIRLEYSPLQQRYTAQRRFVDIQIYRSDGSGWILEVVDDLGNSTLWDQEFATDEAALDCAFKDIESEGIEAFINRPPERTEQLPEPDFVLMFQPLADDEIEALDQFFLRVAPDEAMTFDMVDGFLHALAIGPLTVMPSVWLPKIWGSDNGMMPEIDYSEYMQEMLGLLMRHYNAIISGFKASPAEMIPYWCFREFEGHEFIEAEGWASGFVEGVALSASAWKPLLDIPEGRAWYRPIRLLGEMELDPEDFALSSTPHQRHALAIQIPQSVLAMYAHWLPIRHANYEREVAHRLAPKVGRNDACTCGSGKKFKKCCGSAAVLH